MKKRQTLKIISILLCIFYSFSIFYFIFRGIYRYSLICALCIGITIILNFLNKRFEHLLNPMLSIILALFTLLSLVLGTSYGLYKVNHYDDFLHICSGFIGCAVAYEVIEVYLPKEKRKCINSIFIFVFIFMFSIAVGGLWEILEFSLDVLFKINCQAGGLKDTMVDMIDGLIGTIIMTPFLVKRLGKDCNS